MNLRICISRILSILHTLFFKKIRNARIIIGDNSIIYFRSGIAVSHRAKGVFIGNNCMIGRSKQVYHAGMPFYTTLLCDGDNSIIKIGNGCRINGAYIHAHSNITLGDNCLIASGVNILDSNGHDLYSAERNIRRDKPKPIFIGDHVWIGLNSTILKGTSIGNYSVVATGSVVKGEFPSCALIAGNPARVVKILDIKDLDGANPGIAEYRAVSNNQRVG